MNIRRILYNLICLGVIIYSLIHKDTGGYNMAFDPFSLLIAGIVSSIKINQKVVSLKNKADRDFTQQTIEKTQKGNEATNQLANKYYKEDMVKYMDFLNKNKAQ